MAVQSMAVEYTGSTGADTFIGGEHVDLLYGRQGDDILRGGANSDTLGGGQGTDQLYGGKGWDTLLGGGDNDILVGGLGSDRLDGGDGIDIASYISSTTGIVVDLANPSANSGDAVGDAYVSIEGLQGGDFNDQLSGDAQGNMLIGAAAMTSFMVAPAMMC